jgi:hypothetical protein
MGGPWEKYQQAEQPEAGPWTQYQTPVPPSGIPEPGLSRVGLDIEQLGDAAAGVAKQAALPTLGSIALPAAATAVLGPANAPFVPLEMGIGSGIGEAANQALGITEPSILQIGLAAGLPPVAGYGANVLRGAAKLPGALNTAAPNMAKTQMAGYRGAVPAADVMEQATQQGLTIPLTDTTRVLQEMRNMMFDQTPAGQKAFEKVLKDTGLENLATSPGGITPSKMQALLHDIGKLQADASSETGSGISKEYLGRFFKSLNDDLDNSGSALGPAREYWKREQVLNDIEQRINSAVFTPKGQGSQTQFSAQKIINELNDTSEGLGKWFSQSFSRSEQAEIKNLFGFLNTIPSLQPGAGQQFGSGKFWERVTHAGAGGGIGYGVGLAVAGPPGAAIGGGIGLFAPEAMNIGGMVMQAWKMPGGKQFVKQIFTNEGAITPKLAGALSAFVASGIASKSRDIVQSGTMLQPFNNEQ